MTEPQSIAVEPPSGRTVLVTGGAGFIGSHLVDALVEDNAVRILDNFSSGTPDRVHPDATVFEGDIRDDATLSRAMDGVDLVFHEAALVSVQASVEEPKRSHSVNLEATLSLLECARREDARVVLASSAAIYGQPEYTPIDEGHPTEPSSPYGLEKLTIDRYARLYHELYGLETVALRYFNVYGPRQAGGDYSGVISIFLEQARNGEPITVNGDGTQTRDFVHISDVVQANLLAAQTESVGAAFNVGTGETVTIRELAETIRSVVGSDSEIVHRDPRPGDIEQSQAELSAIRSALGYEPTVTLADGLQTLVEATSNN
ncbi:NAD-dependent epimerase/dehydratase family protein [Natronolimnohabitans innermongolicus]|uniref:NAD-dependent epimerase/dehydratase n=1 Tax=Natronolimnohabitans innermongolicus JCM 12255 TaxID=1227499 RepID=L9XHQ1_9EURY|nr:NAD-dependent epimerase/dehydratase family protein [Natronolimnohabitans innermongolicus]ELY61127.1 NAD-dependent epimerase/dehydratase [Natronolimnohabitans innermongolicus JCM 12255]